VLPGMPAHTGTHTDSPVTVRQMSELVAQVKDEQSYIVVRERTHRNTAESTNSRIKWWSIFQLLVLTGQGFFQVWWLKRFFEVSAWKSSTCTCAGILTLEYRSSALFKDTYAFMGLGWVDLHLHLAVDGRAFRCLAYLAFESMAHQTEIKRREFVRYHIAIPKATASYPSLAGTHDIVPLSRPLSHLNAAASWPWRLSCDHLTCDFETVIANTHIQHGCDIAGVCAPHHSDESFTLVLLRESAVSI
jgi:hypothetical protein